MKLGKSLLIDLEWGRILNPRKRQKTLCNNSIIPPTLYTFPRNISWIIQVTVTEEWTICVDTILVRVIFTAISIDLTLVDIILALGTIPSWLTVTGTIHSVTCLVSVVGVASRTVTRFRTVIAIHIGWTSWKRAYCDNIYPFTFFYQKI